MGNSHSNNRSNSPSLSHRTSAYLDVPEKSRSRRSSVSSAESLQPPPYSRSAPTSRSNSRVRDLSRSPYGHRSSSKSSSRGTCSFEARGIRLTALSASISSYVGKLDVDYLKRPMRKESIDDALELLREYDTVIVVDDSLSMNGPSWAEARDALCALAELAGQYDTSGIDVHFLNEKKSGLNITNLKDVQRLFDRVHPRGATPTGRRLEELLQAYLRDLEEADDAGNRDKVKRVNYIVITDGEATDDPESVIVDNARRLDARHFPLCQVGIQFVQIGNSKKAARHLKELDDNLSSKYNIRDIVDTVPYIGKLQGQILIKILLGAINRKIDKESPETPRALR